MFRISNLVNLYFITLAIAPIICFLDYETVDQGFFKLYGATMLLLAILLLIRNGFSRSKLDIILFFALGVYLYNLAWDIILMQRTLERKGFVFDFFVNPYLHIAAFIYVIDNFKVSKDLVRLLIKVFIGTMLVASVVSFIQVVHDPFFFTPEKVIAYTRMMGAMYNDFEIRRVSIFGYLGNLEETISYLPLVAIVIAYFTLEKKKVPYLLLFLGFIVPFANNYRYAQLGYFITFLPLLIIGKSKLRTFLWITFFTILGGLLFVGILELMGFNLESYVRERLLSNSASTRLLAFEIFKKFFVRHPWFGSGVHLAEEVAVAIGGRSSQIHVGYLSHLYSYGIIGSAITFSFWFMIAKRFYRTAVRTQFWGSFAAILVFLWANVTQVYYQVFSLGLMMAFLFDRYYFTKWQDEITQSNNNISQESDK